ncbi:MAG: hypothetical protein [Olavius algarvensis Gamma 1 endosymbiont]|nr:MAG: hypothetical protein [Olavius algarvensis Gamma 1 endosymbiont]
MPAGVDRQGSRMMIPAKRLSGTPAYKIRKQELRITRIGDYETREFGTTKADTNRHE